MKSCMISIVFMSICCAQGQGGYAGVWVSDPHGQSQNSYEYHQGSGGSDVVSVQTFSGDPYASSSSSKVTSTTGFNDNGTKYYRYTMENTIGNTLYHYERLQWPSLNHVNEFRFRLDLSDPRAAPVWDYLPAQTDNRVSPPGPTGTNQREYSGTIERGYPGPTQQANTGTNQQGYPGTPQRENTGTGQQQYTAPDTRQRAAARRNDG